MTTYERLLKEGEEIGIRKGIRKGEEIGIRKGEEIGIQLTLQVLKLHKKGLAISEIATKLNMTMQIVSNIIEQFFEA